MKNNNLAERKSKTKVSQILLLLGGGVPAGGGGR